MCTFVSLQDIGTTELSDGVIRGILDNQDLKKRTIRHVEITEVGEVLVEEVSKFDYIFYVAKELNPEVNELLQNYTAYLSAEQLYMLMELKYVLRENKVFRSKFSTFDNPNEAEENKYKEFLTSAIISLNKVIKKEKKTIKRWKV